MSINNEGTPAPESIEAKAIAELEKEGAVIEGKEPAIIDVPKEQPLKVETKVEEPSKKVEPKTERTPTMVETWKLRVAEEQKGKLEKELAELQSKFETSKKVDPANKVQVENISDDIEAVIKRAEESGADGTILRDLAKTILSKSKPSNEIEKTLLSIQQERELEKQLNAYQSEFNTDVLPLVKEYSLSEEALSELRGQLKDYAFSDTYAKVPLKEIFKFKEAEFALKAPKRSSEGKGIKARASDVVDLNNLDEDSFKSLTPAQLENFVAANASGGWKRNKN